VNSSLHGLTGKNYWGKEPERALAFGGRRGDPGIKKKEGKKSQNPPSLDLERSREEYNKKGGINVEKRENH